MAERRRLRDQWLHQPHFTCHLFQPWEALGWRPDHQVTGLCAILVGLYRCVPQRHGRALSPNLGFLRRKVRTELVSFLTSELAQGAPQRRARVWVPLRAPPAQSGAQKSSCVCLWLEPQVLNWVCLLWFCSRKPSCSARALGWRKDKCASEGRTCCFSAL